MIVDEGTRTGTVNDLKIYGEALGNLKIGDFLVGDEACCEWLGMGG